MDTEFYGFFTVYKRLKEYGVFHFLPLSIFGGKMPSFVFRTTDAKTSELYKINGFNIFFHKKQQLQHS